jgi:undecaprenyl-diphosphatase
MNNAIFFFFYNFAHKSAIFDRLVVFSAETLPYIVMMLAAIFLLMHHEVLKAQAPFRVFMQKKKEIGLVFFASGFAWIIARLLKIFIHTGRPFVEFSNVRPLFSETGFAFPSGHATFFAALAVSIFFLHPRVGYVFMFFALLIGVARIIAGVHCPVDILGGYILGTLIAYIVQLLAFNGKNV